MNEELTAHARAAVIMTELMRRPQTAKELAEATGLGIRGVYHALDGISIKIPITSANGRWYILTTDEQRDAFLLVRKIEQDLDKLTHGAAFAYPLTAYDARRILHLLQRLVVHPEPE